MKGSKPTTSSMVYVERCAHPGCGKIPSHNHPGFKKGLYCTSHKFNGMVHVGKKPCTRRGCPRTADHGKLFRRKIHCGKHKLPDEYRINDPRCGVQPCGKDPYYTDDGSNYPQRCAKHKLSEDKNIVEKPCSSCTRPDLINEETLLCNDCLESMLL